ncbi:MAG: TFIIB-type zinc finger domain-containing protein [Methanobrevibacter sp.]|jgi:hypothetical protein|nr:TFIIB-type zinc finger domain-containing protein [Candidatus Methanoflexus mossambicus]
MEEVICENCGSKNLAEVNGIATCQSCGTKYPNISLGKIGMDEELKAEEIRRLVELNKEYPNIGHEPTTGILNDEEILKYTPKSHAAKKIYLKRANTFFEKFRLQLAAIVGALVLYYMVSWVIPGAALFLGVDSMLFVLIFLLWAVFVPILIVYIVVSLELR